MSSFQPIEAYASDRSLCLRELSGHLKHGTLALFLGAGASTGMGLPRWWELVNACASSSGVDESVDENTPSDKLMRIMSRVERDCSSKSQYFELVTKKLYSSCADDESLFSQRLLTAVGAATMNSRRGSVSEVITFNFDDILERYLDLHGFTSQVIVDLPVLRRSADVSVYHPHGFLPSRAGHSQSEELIFSKFSFDRRLGDRLNPWQDSMRDLMCRKVCLFVGLSYDNATLSTILADLASPLKNQRGPTGFWLVGPNDDDDTEEELLERNVVPIRATNYSEYSEFMLGICQHAAKSREV